MSLTAVSLDDMLADFDLTAAKWKEFFAANPAAAEVPTDIASSGTVGALVWHIYAAAVRHSERLLGEPLNEFPGAAKSMATAWELETHAAANLRRFVAGPSDPALDGKLSIPTRAGGEVTCSRRKLCMHIFVHAIRHWAQIGPLVRQHGFPVSWPQDILFSTAIR